MGGASLPNPTARIFGLVSAGEGCSFWPYSVIRAEGAAVRIGRACNIQDGAVIHVGGWRGEGFAQWRKDVLGRLQAGEEVGI
jgi:carbonic anhydrase/acetyltransferase-like protein (isoleucine patch superfamily)